MCKLFPNHFVEEMKYYNGLLDLTRVLGFVRLYNENGYGEYVKRDNNPTGKKYGSSRPPMCLQ